MGTASRLKHTMIPFFSRGCFLLLVSAGLAAAQTPQQKAWEILNEALKADNAGNRSQAVRVLGLLKDDPEAAKFAKAALKDSKPEVRTSAADALGQMGAKDSIPELKEALSDKETAVVLAAAHSLESLGDAAGFDIYYEILTGQRKGGQGLLAEQEKMLQDPKKMAQFGFEEGIGYIPFAGLGWSVVKAIAKDDVSPVRAAAARNLASDPDPVSGEALVKATSDKSWVVRAAALDAIAERDDPSLLSRIVPATSDQKDTVRFTAAAAVIHLSDLLMHRKGRAKK